MAKDSTELQQPVWTLNPQGDTRRVGVELEMNGVTIDELAQIAADFLDADIEVVSRYERALQGDPAGEWLVELDSRLIKKLGREQRTKGTLAGDLGDSAEEALSWLAEGLVPLELVSPPLPLDRLDEVERLIKLLHKTGVKGTSDSLLNAFGMQFNPEIPSTDPTILTAYLKAFLCLYEWLYERADIDVSRQVTNYIDPFGKDYARKVVDPDYWPDTESLIEDYLTFNPTRNRALDCLPLFLHLDKERVRAVTQDPLIKPRPAFHYRLPDCEIHLPNWGLHKPWNYWIQVEKLAADSDRLKACCTAYCKFLDSPLERWFGDWEKEIKTQWLDL